MDPVWLARNIATSMRYSPSFGDFFTRLQWTYDKTQASGPGSPEREIGFSYPPPIGRVRLVVRANSGSDHFIHSEVFEHLYYRFPLVTQPRTILDLGANIGLTAVYFARAFPDAALACVEPIPANVALLNRNLGLNRVDATVFDAAVGISDGRIKMLINIKDYGHKVASSDADGQVLDCASITVPTVMSRLGWDRIGLLKVDIEGYEKILFAADCDWLAKVDAMCIEIHEDFSEADLFALADRHGFSTPQLQPGIWLLERPTARAQA